MELNDEWNVYVFYFALILPSLLLHTILRGKTPIIKKNYKYVL